MMPLLKPMVAVASVALPPMPLVEVVCAPKVDQAVCEARVPVKHHQPAKKMARRGVTKPENTSSFLQSAQYMKYPAMIMPEMNHSGPLRLKNSLPVLRRPAAWKPRNSQMLLTIITRTSCVL